MKLGIIGLPQTGKKTLYNLLTGLRADDASAGIKKTAQGFGRIRDIRFDRLSAMYCPRKETPAQIELLLLPKIEKNPESDTPLFREIADADAVCHVVRAFTDESVYHLDGSVNPVRDIESINGELLLHDLLFVEKRLERMAKETKKKNDALSRREEEMLGLFKEQLEKDLPLRLLSLSPDDLKIIRSYPFLTLKKLFIVLNVDDRAIADDSLGREISARFAASGIDVMQVSAKMEGEIAGLDDEDERKEFMAESGISEPALNVLSKLAMNSLELISYFTVGKDEVRQWLVRKGSTAPEAAGVIHSDIQRGFIRAEVIKYPELADLGSEEAVKKAGKLYVMGKDYLVEDGDIISFRFNV